VTVSPQGDSGGPLICDDGTGTWTLRGISSYVANFCNATERPNIYSDVQTFLPWIEDRIGTHIVNLFVLIVELLFFLKIFLLSMLMI